MSYLIDDGIIRLAAKCEKHHRCLQQGREGICPARAYDRHNTLFVECMSTETCIFQKSFDKIHSCTCPGRVEIFRLYGV